MDLCWPRSRANICGDTGCRDSPGKRRNFSSRLCCTRKSRRHANATPSIEIHPVEINSDNFAQFGQVISWQYDGKSFSTDELQLEISRGTPRYYIFRKEERTLNFHKITYHKQVTQCLASVQNSPWYIVVARANFRVDLPPSLADLVAFKVNGGTIVKLNMGTWHAGPFFQDIDSMDFFSLELSDTNIIDHNTYDYSPLNISFEIVDK